MSGAENDMSVIQPGDATPSSTDPPSKCRTGAPRMTTLPKRLLIVDDDPHVCELLRGDIEYREALMCGTRPSHDLQSP